MPMPASRVPCNSTVRNVSPERAPKAIRLPILPPALVYGILSGMPCQPGSLQHWGSLSSPTRASPRSALLTSMAAVGTIETTGRSYTSTASGAYLSNDRED